MCIIVARQKHDMLHYVLEDDVHIIYFNSIFFFGLFKTSKLQILDDEIKSFENKLQQDAAGKFDIFSINCW